MKKFLVFLFIAVLITGMVSAQDRNGRQRVNPQAPQTNERQRADSQTRTERPAPQTIEGTLKLVRGFIAVQSGENVYMAPMLTRYIGFINGLREDAKISIEGFLFRNMIHPVKVTIGEKSYDFMRGPAFGMQNNFGNMHRNFNQRGPVPGIRERSNTEEQKQRPGADRENPRQNRRNSSPSQGTRNRAEQG